MSESALNFDPIRVGLFTELFASIAEEMGSILERVSFSPNIKERRDYSCAVFDASGRLVAQAAHIPVHLGAMEFLMQKWLRDGPKILPGRLYVTNDPYFAGTHLPDISILRAVHHDGELIGFVANRAHHADVGGVAPGSIAPVTSVEHEGLILSPRELTSDVISTIASSSRSPSERLGDLEAQRAAADMGARRYMELAERYVGDLERRISECLLYAEAVTRAALSSIPVGTYTAKDFIEDIPGCSDGMAKLSLTITSSQDGGIKFDFAGSEHQKEIGVNATEAVTRSACYYVVRCLAPDAPTNGGCWAPVQVFAPPGSVVNATFPAPVVAGNTETSQRIVDVILQALSTALPDVIPACSQGTMNNLAIGGDDWAYYETIGGGAGAGPLRNGAHAIHTHMTNTRNTPVEAIENELPLRVREYALRAASGGHGEHRGGDGVVREIEILADEAVVSLMTDRRKLGPPGAKGGHPGAPGVCLLLTSDGEVKYLPSKCACPVRRGDRIRIETPGGGGWGSPKPC